MFRRNIMVTSKTFRKAIINLYSFEEWKYLPSWGMDMAIAYFDPHPDNGEIHICVDIKGLIEDSYTYRKLWDSGKFPNGQETLTHEYTHYLQWVYGKGITTPLGLDVPIKVITQKVYEPEYWDIEAEASWVEKRPWLLDELERKVFS
jgi:hypothetical protein